MSDKIPPNTPADSLAREVLDTLPFNIAIIDRQGVIVDSNRAWREFGENNDLAWAADTIGINYLDVTESAADEYAQQAATGIRDVLTGDRHLFTLEYPCNSPDEQRWFLLRVTSFSYATERYATVAHINITERKVAELDAEERAQDLAAERDHLALLNQIVRHDIRNDMAVILGWGDELKQDVLPEGETALERILNAATHTKELTTAVRDLAEILDRDESSLTSVCLPTVLREEIDRVRSNFEYRSDSVTITGESDLPETCSVLATPLVSSLFGNLLDNAVFHNDKSTVEISVQVQEKDDTVVVRIADNGPGVPDSRKREIFARKEKGLESSGSGLGLFLVDFLVDMYDGSVWIEDNDPEGAVFCVELQQAQSIKQGIDN